MEILIEVSSLNRAQNNRVYFSDIMEFLETNSGMEQMDSTLMFGRIINAEHPQSELYRVAREAPDDELEVIHSVSYHN
jgi:hypothetical protein